MSLTELRARLKVLDAEMETSIAAYTALAGKTITLAADADDAAKAAHVNALADHNTALAAALKAIEDKTAEMERVNGNIDILEAAEKVRAKAAVPANDPVGTERAPAQVAVNLKASEKVGLMVAAMAA